MRKRVWLMLLAALVVVGLWSLPTLVDVSRYQKQIVRALTAITGRKVHLGSVSLAPTRGLVLQLNDLVIEAINPEEPPVFQVADAYLGLGFSVLYNPDSIKISSINLVKPQINLVIRRGLPLLERAQETAKESSDKMSRVLGRGLADLSVSEIVVRDGLLTILDWDHPHGQTWLMDRLQLSLHNISPSGASPLSVTARFQDIPISVNGHIGPLSESLDLASMPILLSMNAKAEDLTHFFDTLSTLPVAPQASRGFFTALLHGSILDGLQTTARMELERLIFSAHDDKSPPTRPTDVALRQKSRIIFSDKGPVVEFKEAFVHVNARPVISIGGRIGPSHLDPVALTVRSLAAIDPAMLPFSFAPWRVREAVEGSVILTGSAAEGIRVETNLDFTKADIALPPRLRKKSGVPLRVAGKYLLSSAGRVIEEMVVNGAEGTRLSVAGAVDPVASINVKGALDLSQLHHYLPAIATLEPQGASEVDLFIVSGSALGVRLEGRVLAKDSRFGPWNLTDLDSELVMESDLLRLPRFSARLLGGRMEGTLIASLQGQEPLWLAGFQLTGERLSPFLAAMGAGKETVSVDGSLFAQGMVQGYFGPSPLQPEILSGRVSLLVEPGYLSGADRQTWLRHSSAGLPTDGEKRFPFDRLRAEASFQNGAIRFEGVHMEGMGLSVSGHGVRSSQGGVSFDLTATPSWDPGAAVPVLLRLAPERGVPAAGGGG